MKYMLSDEELELVFSATIRLVTENGIWGCTLFEIGQEAGIPEGRILDCYASKNELFVAYYQWIQQQIIDEFQEIEDFEEFSLQEKLQLFLENQLEALGPHRQFVKKTFIPLFISPLSCLHGKKYRTAFRETMKSFLDGALVNQEISPQIYQKMIPDLLGAYYIFILGYWIKDDSEDYVNTSQVLDLTLGVVVEPLQSQLTEKTKELISLLFRLHLYPRLGTIMGVFTRFKKSFSPQGAGATEAE